MKQTFAKSLVEAGSNVTVDQWVVLEQLVNNEGVTQLALAKLTFKDPPTVTRIIDLLVQKQLVERIPNDNDRRSFKILLTPNGKVEVKKIKKLSLAFRKKIYQGLKSKDVTQLEYILEMINDNLINIK